MTQRIISCNVFRDALSFLDVGRRCPGVIVQYLPAHLHLYPAKLKQRLLAEIRRIHPADTIIGCLYGRCFDEIDSFLKPCKIPRIPCDHCYQRFLGKRRYRQMTESHPGIFFLEKQLLINFDDYCRSPLELDDPLIRRMYFEHYRK